MSFGAHKRNPRVPTRSSVVFLLVILLVFPPWAFGDAITWNGGTGNYSDPGNWTCGACGGSAYPNNGIPFGIGYEATINSGGTDVANLDVTSIVNSMAIGGTSGGSSTLNVTGGYNLTFGTPSISSGNVLNIGNGGILNVNSGSAAILEFSGGATGLLGGGGQINVTDGGTLTLQNTNAGGSSTLTNNGTLTIAGTSSAATLQTNGGSGTAFSISGAGALTLGGLGQIVVAAGNSLTIGTNLTNLNGASLTGGSYVVGNGATLELSALGGGYVGFLNGANVTVSGSGLLTGDGSSNALRLLTEVYSGPSGTGSLTLNSLSSPLTVTPGGSTFYVSSDDYNTAGTDINGGTGQSTLTLNGTTVVIADNFVNQANTGVAGNSGIAISTVALNNGSSLTVDTLTNQSADNGGWTGLASSQVSVTGASSLTVNSDVNNLTTQNNGFGGTSAAGISLAGSSSMGVGGSFANGVGGNNTANFTLGTNSTATVAGLFTNGQYGNLSVNASTLTTNGGMSNDGTVNVLNGSTLTDAGLTITGGSLSLNGSTLTETGSITNSGGLFLASGSTGTVTGLLTNNSGGSVAVSGSTLTTNGGISNSGSFELSSGATLVDSGLTNNSGGSVTVGASTLTENGVLSNSGSLSLSNGSTATVSGLFTNSSGGSVTVNGSSLSTTGAFANSGSLSLSNGSTGTMGGVFTNNSGASVTVDGSTLQTNGGISNAGSVGLSNGASLVNTGLFDNTGGTLTLNGGGNAVTANGVTNTNGSITVGAGDTADFRGSGSGRLTNLSGGTLNGGTYTLNGNLFYSTGSDSSTNIQTLSGVTMAVGSSGGILFGSGSGSNALTQLGTLENSSLTLTGQSMTINPNGNHSAFTLDPSTLTLSSGSTLNIQGTVNNGAGSSIALTGGGNSLAATGLTNNGTISVGAGDTADFRNGGAGQLTNLSGGTLSGGTYNLAGSLFYDTGQDASTNILAISGATVSLTNAGAFLFGGGSGTDALGQLGAISSNGSLTVNGATRSFDPGSGTFVLNSSTLNVNNGSAITIQGALQNGGTVGVDGTSILNVQGELAGLSSGTLSGGAYNIGGTLHFDTSGVGNDSIQTLNGVDLTLAGTGNVVYGTGSGTSALSQLSGLTNSSLTLNGQTLAINPNGNNSAFTLDPSTLTLNGSSLTIAGPVNNTNGSTIALNYAGGSASTLGIGGVLSNDSTSSVSLNGGGNSLTAQGLTNYGSISVGANDTADFRNGGLGQLTTLSGGTLSGGTYNLTGNLFYDTGIDGSTNIQTLSGVNMALNGTGAILYGTGGGTDALAQLGALTNSSVFTLNGVTRTLAPLSISSSTLNVIGGSSATFGTPALTSGNVLSNNNGGIVNVGSAGNAILELSGGATALNDVGGQINVTDGGTLTLQNTNAGTSTITNNGNISVAGTSSAATMLLNDGNTASTFTLGGTGTLTLAGLGRVAGDYGDETLINGSSHTITGSGSITNLNLVNNGNITASNGGNLIIDATTTGSLTNNVSGNMNVADGGTMTIRNNSENNTVVNNNGNIYLNGATTPTSLIFDNTGAGGIGSTFTLTGTGTLTMTNNLNNVIAGASGNEYLINDVNHTIQGAGTISNFANFTNNGILNSGNSAGLTLDLTHSSSWSGELDTFTNGGTVNVTEGSALTVVSNAGTGIYNAGTINLGSTSDGSAGHLVLNDNTNGATFDLGAGGNGSIVMSNNAANSITGFNGTEIVNNDANHTIAGAGSISNIGAFTNFGTLQSLYSGGSLVVANSANLTNWDGVGTLYGGTYVANDGSKLQLSAMGSNQIQTLWGSNVVLNGTGLLTGDGTTNAAATINNIYSGDSGQGSLTLNSTGAVTLATSGGAFAVAADDNLAEYGNAALQLNGTTAATINGDLYNAGTSGNGGSGNSTVALSSGATLSVNNLANSATNISSYSGFGSASAQVNLTGASALTVNNNLSNISTDDGFDSGSQAQINLTGGSTLTVKGAVSNTSVGNDPSYGGSNGAVISLDGSGTGMNVTGAFTNQGTVGTSGNSFYSQGSGLLLSNNSTAVISGLFSNNGGSLVSLDLTGNGGSSLTANAGFSNYNSYVALSANSTLVVAGGFTNSSDDSNGTGASLLSIGPLNENNNTQSLTNNRSNPNVGPTYNATITGGLLNTATTSNGGEAASGISITGGGTLSADTLTNTATAGTSGSNDSASAQVSLSGAGSLLAVTGNVINSSYVTNGSLGIALASISLDQGSNMTVGGTFNNTAASLTLTNVSTATVTGLFTNDGNSTVSLDNLPENVQRISGSPAPTSGRIQAALGSTLTTNGGFTNQGIVNLNYYSNLNNTGLFSNSGAVNVSNASTVTNTGDFSNSGTLATSGTGLNQVNVTGSIFNTSLGIVNVNGDYDAVTASGQFSNHGAVSLNGDNASVSGTWLHNHSDGTITLTGTSQSVTATATSTGAMTNYGTIDFAGTSTDGLVSSAGGFSNNASGVVTMSGTGDVLSAAGNMSNAGAVTVGAGEGIMVTGNYNQTAGTTAIDSAGNLSAALVDITGGVLSGGGTITGNLTIDGGTLAPGDPQSMTVIGDYDQTSAGIFDVDILSASSYDQVNIQGNATLGGTLDITIDPNFDGSAINANTVFELMSWTGTETGNFSSINGLDINGLNFTEQINGNQLDLDITNTPEPSTLSMLFCAMLIGAAIAWRVRRRANIVK